MSKNQHGILEEDADECINGVFCVHLGVQMGEFVDNFEREEV